MPFASRLRTVVGDELLRKSLLNNASDNGSKAITPEYFDATAKPARAEEHRKSDIEEDRECSQATYDVRKKKKVIDTSEVDTDACAIRFGSQAAVAIETIDAFRPQRR
jgi:hypothetical protein